MSAQFFQSDTRQNNQYIKCEDLTIRGVCEYEDTGATTMSGKITYPAMPVYTQLTSTTATVSISGAEQQFIVDTYAAGSIPAGTSVTFNVNSASIVLNKTIVVMNKMGSTSALTEVNDFVSITAAGGMTITRHNFGSGAAVGLQRLCFKLIQTK